MKMADYIEYKAAIYFRLPSPKLFSCVRHVLVLFSDRGTAACFFVPAVTLNKTTMQRTVKSYAQYSFGKEYSIWPAVADRIRPLRAAAVKAAASVSNHAVSIAVISAAAVFTAMAAGLTAVASLAAFAALIAVSLINDPEHS